MTHASEHDSHRAYFWRIRRPVCGVATRRAWRSRVVLVFALGVLLLHAAGASATPPPPEPLGPTLRSGSQLVMASPITGPGQNINGYTANPANGFEPFTCNPPGSTNCTSNYPLGNPTPVGTAANAWTQRNGIFAGNLRANPVPNPDSITILLYCIDIHTPVGSGYGYGLGSWEGSGVPNVGYVARILNFYYPNVPDQPSSLSTANQRAAAVQAAIWFFTDRFVLNTNQDALRTATMGIVNTVLHEGPLHTPAPPSLAINPASRSGHVDVHGPFRVTSNHTPVTLTVTGGTMHASGTSTTPLPNPETVNSGDFERWLRPVAGNTTRIVTLQATSTSHVPSGNVYLFNQTCTAGGNCPQDAQRLILAAPATFTTTVQATGEFKPFGHLIVRKTIDGPAAGSRGEVRIQVTCDDGVQRPDFVIAPGSSVREHTFSHIPADTQCTVTETSNGSTSTVTVTVSGNGQEVTIPAGGDRIVHITDTYHFVPGQLIVRKIIGGLAAGQQGEIVIRTVCGGHHLTPDFVIPPGRARVYTPYPRRTPSVPRRPPARSPRPLTGTPPWWRPRSP